MAARPKRLKTPQASKKLEIPQWKIIYLLREGYIPQPKRNYLGHFLWTPRDLWRAAAAAKRHSR